MSTESCDKITNINCFFWFLFFCYVSPDHSNKWAAAWKFIYWTEYTNTWIKLRVRLDLSSKQTRIQTQHCRMSSLVSDNRHSNSYANHSWLEHFYKCNSMLQFYWLFVRLCTFFNELNHGTIQQKHWLLILLVSHCRNLWLWQANCTSNNEFEWMQKRHLYNIAQYFCKFHIEIWFAMFNEHLNE